MVTTDRSSRDRRVLVTGVSGRLGGVAARAFRDAGWQVTGTVLRHPCLATGVAVVTADLSREDGLEEAWNNARPALVVNAAALADAAVCEQYPEAARRMNADLPGRLAQRAAAEGAGMIHISTDLVFGGTAAPYAESSVPDPVSVYGSSKAAGETEVLAAHPGALVARVALLYGRTDPGTSASEALLREALAGREASLFEDEWRTPVEVSDVAVSLVALAEAGTEGVVHLAGPDRLSRADFGARVLEGVPGASCRAVPQAGYGGPDPRPQDVSLGCEAALAVQGVRLRGVTEALAELADLGHAAGGGGSLRRR